MAYFGIRQIASAPVVVTGDLPMELMARADRMRLELREGMAEDLLALLHPEVRDLTRRRDLAHRDSLRELVEFL